MDVNSNLRQSYVRLRTKKERWIRLHIIREMQSFGSHWIRGTHRRDQRNAKVISRYQLLPNYDVNVFISEYKQNTSHKKPVQTICICFLQRFLFRFSQGFSCLGENIQFFHHYYGSLINQLLSISRNHATTIQTTHSSLAFGWVIMSDGEFRNA